MRRAGLLVSLAALVSYGVAQHLHPGEPLTQPDPELREPLLLIRQGRTDEARKALSSLLAKRPGDAAVSYQIARAHLADFYASADPARGRLALSLAMETLEGVLRTQPDHIPALKAKAMIHARAELLYYDPNLAYSLAARVARLQPSANEYLLNLTDWLSGEIRFTAESGHRVPHDPLLGLDRSIELLDAVLDSTVPHGGEESLALYQMARTLAKRGDFAKSIEYFHLTLSRSASQAGRPEILRELGVSYYRMGNFAEASRNFYRALTLRNHPVDQWLLKVSLEQAGGTSSSLPPMMVFPAYEPKIDPGQPPLPAFRDAAAELGVNRFDGNGTCAFGDFTGDTAPDLILAGSGHFLAAYRNRGGRFEEITAEAGLDKVPSAYSVNLVDIDNDGKLDLYLSLNGWNGPMADRLYRNAGGRFVDISPSAGAADPGSGFVSLWGDLDNDGLPDLVVANGVLKDGSVPRIYRNLGGGKFEDVTKAAGIQEPAAFGTIGAALGDYDRDGDLDLFFNGLVNSPNRLYRNDGGFRFTDGTRASGLAQQPPHNGFVAFFTDYDNDTFPDLLVTSLAPWDVVVEGLKANYPQSLHNDATRLFHNNRDGTFRDATLAAGLHRPMGVMGAGVADLDNDGFVDFYFGTGDPQLSRIEPNRFFRNNGDGTFSDLTKAAGFARPGNKGHGACFVDIDNDGDLDFYQQLGGHYPGDHAANAFHLNLLGNRNRWLQIELEGVKSNRFAIGAGVTVKAGALTQFREVKGSEGFGATSPYLQHFGLGKQDAIEEVIVSWPGGARQGFTGLSPNRRYRIREGDPTPTELPLSPAGSPAPTSPAPPARTDPASPPPAPPR